MTNEGCAFSLLTSQETLIVPWLWFFLLMDVLSRSHFYM